MFQKCSKTAGGRIVTNSAVLLRSQLPELNRGPTVYETVGNPNNIPTLAPGSLLVVDQFERGNSKGRGGAS